MTSPDSSNASSPRKGPPLQMEALDVKAVPPGEIRRVRVEVAQNGLGAEVAVPMLVARGRKPGPTLGITCAVHGDELNGIPAVHRVFANLNPSQMRGNVVGVLVVNVPGFHRRQRRLPGGMDPNHLFPGLPNGNSAQLYAHNVFNRIVSKFDFLLDMHTASSGRVNSLYVRANMEDPSSAEMAYLQQPQIIVHNPPTDGTLRGAAHDAGIPAVTVEIGNPRRFQRDLVKKTVKGVQAVLFHTGIIQRKRPVPTTDAVICTRSQWMYTSSGGWLEVLPDLTELVKKDQVVARLLDIYGDPVKEYRAPHDGIIIGKSVDPVAVSGDRILHLGVVATEQERLAFLPPERVIGALRGGDGA